MWDFKGQQNREKQKGNLGEAEESSTNKCTLCLGLHWQYNTYFHVDLLHMI